MTSEINNEILGILSRFTYYDIKDLEIDNDTIKFKYLSVFRDIICQCELSENTIRIIVNNNEWLKLINKKDVILDIGISGDIFDYLDTLESDRFNIVKSNDNYKFEFKQPKRMLRFLNNGVELVDKLLLNICLIVDNKDIIDSHINVCMYPGYYEHIDYVSSVFAVNINYISYMSEIYRRDIRNTSINKGVEFDDRLSFLESTSIMCYWDISLLRTNRFVNINEVIVPNRNLIKIIKLLGKIVVYDDTHLIIRDNELVLISDTQIKVGVRDREIYPYIYLKEKICDKELSICKIIDDTPIIKSRNKVLDNILVLLHS